MCSDTPVSQAWLWRNATLQEGRAALPNRKVRDIATPRSAPAKLGKRQRERRGKEFFKEFFWHPQNYQSSLVGNHTCLSPLCLHFCLEFFSIILNYMTKVGTIIFLELWISKDLILALGKNKNIAPNMAAALSSSFIGHHHQKDLHTPTFIWVCSSSRHNASHFALIYWILANQIFHMKRRKNYCMQR